MTLRSAAAALLAAALVLFTPAVANAQQEPDPREDWLDIEVGKSVVLETPDNATAIAITNPEVADVVTLATAKKIQVQGKEVGTTDLVIQLGPGTPPIIYEITVHQDLSELVRRVGEIVEGAEPPNVYPLLERIVVQGPVPDLDTLERIAQVAQIYDPEFVNLMTVRGDHQVQLEVVFAEVSRTGIREMGLNALWGDDDLGFGINGPSTLGGGDFVANPNLANRINGGITNTGAPTGFQIAGFIGAADLSLILGVLDDHRLAKTLANPTLVALSGQQAEFLAGGEIPIPIPSGNGTISIEFREYGVKLVFVPTVLGGDVIDMRVFLEVSEPDFAIGTRITGIEVPGFISRKGQSHLRLDSGMTFAMAGLLSESIAYSRAEVPILGRIPILGSLFRYTRHQREETELMMFVTPRLVRPLSPGEVPAHPGAYENNNPSDFELFLLGMGTRPGSRSAEPTGPLGLQR